jgi:hypothetical protein
MSGVQGHRQGRNEESGVTWSAWPSRSYLWIQERKREAGGRNDGPQRAMPVARLEVEQTGFHGSKPVVG